VVVEARERVGGRVLNHDIGDGKVVEVGGQWIGPTQDRLAALAAELGVETVPTHGEGENLIEYGGTLRRYSGTIPRINPAVLVDVERAQRRLNRLARSVPLAAPWEAPGARKLDGQTLATWMRRNLATKPGRMLLELGVEAVWAAQPEDMSLLHALFYIHSAGSLDLLFDTEGGAQQDRFVGGSQLVPVRMAEELGEERLVLGSPVRRIEHSGDGVTVHADGSVLRGKRAILALAPTLAARIAYDPPLPGYRDQLTQRMPLGTVAKCMAIYDEPFWRAVGLSGQGASERGPVRLTFDNSPPDGSPGVLLGFLEGRRARELGRLPEEERRTAVIDCFARMFGPRARAPDAYVERLWAEEEWTRGCYGCLMPTGAWTNYGPALHPPIGPLHWAGAEYARFWNGYMDGAVRSGEAAAAELVEVL
jgi:monoamine oxidase